MTGERQKSNFQNSLQSVAIERSPNHGEVEMAILEAEDLLGNINSESFNDNMSTGKSEKLWDRPILRGITSVGDAPSTLNEAQYCRSG